MDVEVVQMCPKTMEDVVQIPVPNPHTDRVPTTVGVRDGGGKRSVRFVVERSGTALRCELCEGVRDSEEHRESEGHVYERERQRFWVMKCLLCKVACDGLNCFEDHVKGNKHRRTIVDSGLLAADVHEVFCAGLPLCRQC